MIPGFRRWQESSYLALRLPFDWWLWGLDTEVGQVDERQRDFFRRLFPDPADRKGEKTIPPDKLIVCTCSPTTVFRPDRQPERREVGGRLRTVRTAPAFPAQAPWASATPARTILHAAAATRS
jgi:hypothetical protein